MTATDFDALETPLVTKRQRIGKAVLGQENERTIQRRIVKELRRLGFRVTAVRNGVGLKGDARARMLQGVAARLDGVETGFPDLILQKPARRFSPADFGQMEVKQPGGSLSPDQIEMGERARRDGIKYAVVTSLDEALAVLGKWGWL